MTITTPKRYFVVTITMNWGKNHCMQDLVTRRHFIVYKPVVLHEIVSLIHQEVTDSNIIQIKLIINYETKTKV